MSFQPKIFNAIADSLSDKQREVIEGRFGLGKQKEQRTLDSIGKDFGVTRERVRQIEASALQVLSKSIAKNALAQNVLGEAKARLKEIGGVSAKASLVADLSRSRRDLEENQLNLLHVASHGFFAIQEDEEFVPLYYLDKMSLAKASAFLSQWASALRVKRSSFVQNPSVYGKELKKFASQKRVPVSHAENYASVSKRISKNPYGDTGLAEWPEISPYAIKDRIYLALKKHGEPAHFTEIANIINRAQYDGARFALASTVHNELIKDGRFVLVGRGMYALREHGYEPGNAKDVIARVLRKSGPLPSGQIVLSVLKERLFKENTILVNLQNREFFERKADGRYDIREA